MQFEWDAEKAETNLNKHGVSFAEASTVFGDLSAKMFFDDEPSIDEKREFIVGYSEINRLLVVYFTERENRKVRIIPHENPPISNGRIMKKMNNEDTDEMKSEYRFDYSKAQPNRFAKEYNRMQRTVVLDADVADDFPSSESVNEALRFLSRITKQHKNELTHK